MPHASDLKDILTQLKTDYPTIFPAMTPYERFSIALGIQRNELLEAGLKNPDIPTKKQRP